MEPREKMKKLPFSSKTASLRLPEGGAKSADVFSEKVIFSSFHAGAENAGWLAAGSHCGVSITSRRRWGAGQW
jgi:hypothetical protein